MTIIDNLPIHSGYNEYILNIYKYDCGWKKERFQLFKFNDGLWNDGVIRQAGRTTKALEVALDLAFSGNNVTYISPTLYLANFVIDKLKSLKVPMDKFNNKVIFNKRKMIVENGGSLCSDSSECFPLLGKDGILMFDHSASDLEGYFINKYIRKLEI